PADAMHPRVVDGVEASLFWPARGARPAIYIVGHRELNRYLTVPQHSLDAVCETARLFDGRRSIDAVERHLLACRRQKVDVRRIHEQLARAGLLASDNAVSRGIDRLIIGVLDVKLPPVPRAIVSFVRVYGLAALSAGGAVILA